jgi:16S rRNA (cytosine1402-N4)-methyltransferase
VRVADLCVHVPVMSAEVLALLAPQRGGVFLDCTVGLGGHAQAVLAAGASRLLGLDRDREALSQATDALASWGDRVELVHADYRDVARVLDERGVEGIDGAVADLGVSSWQLDRSGRGFSFQRDEPLDMRMDPSTGPTAADLLAAVEETELANVIYQFGEERRSRAVARAIVNARRPGRIATTGQLASIVRRVVGRGTWQRIDPATRTFQAIRIWVNRELDGLDGFLRAVSARLRVGGRLVVLTFHSLEDRPVKHVFRELVQGGPTFAALTKKPLVAQDDERHQNPRAMSAKLRAIARQE